MKTGKFITLGYINNVKVGYGTVDYKNLKTIYIKLNSWIAPAKEDDEFYSVVNKARHKIRSRIYCSNINFFKKESIVDLDVKTKGIKIGKKSFLNLEITLFARDFFDIKSKDVRKYITELSRNIIRYDLNNKKLFNFHKNKK